MFTDKVVSHQLTMAESTHQTFTNIPQLRNTLQLAQAELYALKKLLSVYLPPDEIEEMFRHINNVLREVYGEDRVTSYFNNQDLFISNRESDEYNEAKESSITKPENPPAIHDENACGF